jgi:NAD(P)H-dependent flavin oxidoreductase YrpB (nitropropane dioxygenase family)
MTTSLPLPRPLQGLRLPVIAAPMLTVRDPLRFSALCRAGVAVSMHAIPSIGKLMDRMEAECRAATQHLPSLWSACCG